MNKRTLAASKLLAVTAGLIALISTSGRQSFSDDSNNPPAKAPELIGVPSNWINTPSGANYRLYGPDGIFAVDPFAPGKHAVVIADFWEYDCINCKHVLPYVKDLANRYKSSGLVVIGIHTPEIMYHHSKPYVVQAVHHDGIHYPVLLDNEYKNWNAYNNEYWPNFYVIDHDGKIVYSYSGEGDYQENEQTIRQLLLKANPGETLPKALL